MEITSADQTKIGEFLFRVLSFCFVYFFFIYTKKREYDDEDNRIEKKKREMNVHKSVH